MGALEGLFDTIDMDATAVMSCIPEFIDGDEFPRTAPAVRLAPADTTGRVRQLCERKLLI